MLAPKYKDGGNWVELVTPLLVYRFCFQNRCLCPHGAIGLSWRNVLSPTTRDKNRIPTHVPLDYAGAWESSWGLGSAWGGVSPA